MGLGAWRGGGLGGRNVSTTLHSSVGPHILISPAAPDAGHNHETEPVCCAPARECLSLVAHGMRDILLDATGLAGVVAILRDDLAHLPAAADDCLAVLLLVLDTRVAGEG